MVRHCILIAPIPVVCTLYSVCPMRKCQQAQKKCQWYSPEFTRICHGLNQLFGKIQSKRGASVKSPKGVSFNNTFAFYSNFITISSSFMRMQLKLNTRE